MFRRVSIGKNLIAFLLPLTFIWSWAACFVLCGELTAQHEKQSILSVEQTGENCLVGFDTESCPYTAVTVVIEARQTPAAPTLSTANVISLSSPKFSFVVTSIYSSDTHQNSPPRADFDPPLFLKHQAFRI